MIPTTFDQIDAAWLTEALGQRHPGARVRGVEVLERREVTNSHARLRVSYDAPAGAPETLFCKLLPSESGRREAIAATGMGLREARFYDGLAGDLGMRVPAVHGVRFDEADGAFVLLLEDLVESGCSVSDGTQGVAVDPAARALQDLAELHVRFEDRSERKRWADWVAEPEPSSDYGAVRLRYGLDHHRDRLGDAFVELAELYIDNREALHALWHPGPQTLIHGDVHIGNLFQDGDRTGFLDWGIITVSTPLRDLSYFLTMAMSIEDRRANERELIAHYLDVRKALRGESIGFDEAWKAHRIHAAYNVPASCQVVTFPEDATEQRRVFADAFLARAQASLEDLEVRQALRKFADL
ncbi:MAG: phosphotransferase [Myxococcota bacterium]|nr:phosphotransferase [Myxococcota bacterium]